MSRRENAYLADNIIIEVEIIPAPKIVIVTAPKDCGCGGFETVFFTGLIQLNFIKVATTTCGEHE